MAVALTWGPCCPQGHLLVSEAVVVGTAGDGGAADIQKVETRDAAGDPSADRLLPPALPAREKPVCAAREQHSPTVSASGTHMPQSSQCRWGTSAPGDLACPPTGHVHARVEWTRQQAPQPLGHPEVVFLPTEATET